MRCMVYLSMVISVLCLAVWCGAASDEEKGVRYNAQSDGLVIHEWGVIRDSLKGKEALLPSDVPDFVVNSSVEVYPPDADKPVIYIYSDKETKLDLAVGIPSYGAILHWPPAEVGEYVKRERPSDGIADKDANGALLSSEGTAAEVFWKDVTVQATRESKMMRSVKAAHWWNQSRKVGSNIVAVGGEEEKFLFYEAPGMYYIPAARPKLAKDNITELSLREGSLLAGAEKPAFANLFVVNIAKGSGKMMFKSSFAMGSGAQSIDLGSAEAKSIDSDAWKNATTGRLQTELESTGLYTDEAQQVAKIWQEEFFQRDGNRVIYFLQSSEYDKLFPLYVSVKPDQIARVMMVMIEY